MEQLSSCYFCGGALDASLDEYPVVPKDLHPTPDDQKTVVLCQGCRQKLGTVVETVVTAVDRETVGERADADGASTNERTGDDPGADASAADEWISADTLADDATSESDDTDPLAEDDDEPPVDRTDRSDAAADSADDGPSLTALEYNKVMRLLQNREFPVDREEIRDVAVNAYEISESEFDSIIDAAIEKGLIDQENGKFVEGE